MFSKINFLTEFKKTFRYQRYQYSHFRKSVYTGGRDILEGTKKNGKFLDLTGPCYH